MTEELVVYGCPASDEAQPHAAHVWIDPTTQRQYRCPGWPGAETEHRDIPQVCPHCAQNLDILVRGRIIYVSAVSQGDDA